jgi:hypothetical protein
MEMEKLFERLVAKMDADRRTDKEEMVANRKKDKEEMEAKRKTDKEDFLAKLHVNQEKADKIRRLPRRGGGR